MVQEIDIKQGCLVRSQFLPKVFAKIVASSSSGKESMINNVQIDEKLIEEALVLSDRPTIDLLLEDALREYIQRRQQLKILDLFGTIDYEESYNYNKDKKHERYR
ncbi:type II toxin-antitoxin system VapB family antitoxin [Oscillatoria amoena NRMC-F 0135]|nr:type II toxin-antitoxin system VapB family antitoxin [Desertifilum sp.]MDI9640732.1 type II toxin-antitoxin system VapB family antitoxin [Geitlerinema splendidum]MDL5050023.1 type II toxin-antitoxin system VapB family antitoxin [Oscillatoria amoena NRMC-F 0135]